MITWREQIVSTILLIVARMFVDDEELSTSIKNLGIAIRARNAA